MAGIQIDGVNNKIDFDDDADTSISSSTDDTLVVEVGGSTLATATTTSLTINDSVTITTADNTDTLTLTSTDADANSGPNIVLNRDSGSPADNDIVGQFTFRADNDAGEATDYCRFRVHLDDVSDGTEDGNFRLFTLNGGAENSRIDIDKDETVFNEDSADLDFRVESNGDANCLRIKGDLDCVIVGSGSRSSDAKFNVVDSGNAKTIEVDNTNASIAQDMIRIDATRSSSGSFNFLRMMSGNSADTEFIMTGEGNMYADGTFNANGADYAEFFETNDGNSIDVGKTVVLDGNKVRASTSSDDAATVIGVVRPKVDGINSMIIGNTAWNSWTNKYMHDDYGRFIMEDYTVTEWVVKTYEDGTQKTESYETDKIPSDVTVPSDAVVKTQQRRKANPDYDKSKEYKSRAERDEWVIIGMLGQIQVEKGQTVGDHWIKMRDISDTVEEWLVR